MLQKREGGGKGLELQGELRVRPGKALRQSLDLCHIPGVIVTNAYAQHIPTSSSHFKRVAPSITSSYILSRPMP